MRGLNKDTSYSYKSNQTQVINGGPWIRIWLSLSQNVKVVSTVRGYEKAKANI